jgi:hypothetical protein
LVGGKIRRNEMAGKSETELLVDILEATLKELEALIAFEKPGSTRYKKYQADIDNTKTQLAVAYSKLTRQN